MSYKPDESALIAYLYGELNEKEKQKLENYFSEHPEDLEKLKALGEVRNILSHAQDKEVIAPPVFVDDSGTVPLWRSSYFRFSLGIAASILFLLVAGKLLGPEISYTQGELKISFGKKIETVQPNTNNLTEQKVNELIEASLAKNNDQQASIRTEEQNKLLKSMTDFNSKKIDALAKSASQASREQVQSFVAGLQEGNLKLLKDYMKLSSDDQKKYMENLLTDFSSFLQEQRKQDLQFVQSKMNYLEKDNSQFKQETEQLLTSLISNPVKNKNNY